MTDQELQKLMRECLWPYFENLRRKGSIPSAGDGPEARYSYHTFLTDTHAAIVNHRAAHAVLLNSSEKQAIELLHVFSEELGMFEVNRSTRRPRLTREKEGRLEEAWEMLLEDTTKEMFPKK